MIEQKINPSVTGHAIRVAACDAAGVGGRAVDGQGCDRGPSFPGVGGASGCPAARRGRASRWDQCLNVKNRQSGTPKRKIKKTIGYYPLTSPAHETVRHRIKIGFRKVLCLPIRPIKLAGKVDRLALRRPRFQGTSESRSRPEKAIADSRLHRFHLEKNRKYIGLRVRLID